MSGEGPSAVMPAAADDHPGRAAVVTGASSGIGRALAAYLADNGYAVTLVARNRTRLEAFATSLAARERQTHVVVGDLTDEPTIRRAVAEHQHRFDRLDVLVNCAGLGVAESIANVSARQLDQQYAVNVRATALMCREAIALLTQAGAEHGNALILNMASVVGKQGASGFGGYSATKFAVVGLTQSLNLELAHTGVKATVLCPALVDTPMTDFLKDTRPGASMIQTRDLVLALDFLLRLSPAAVVPELVITSPGGALHFE